MANFGYIGYLRQDCGEDCGTETCAVTTCEQFDDCFGIVGSTMSVTMEVDVSASAPVDPALCINSDCSPWEGTHIMSSFTSPGYIGSCDFLGRAGVFDVCRLTCDGVISLRIRGGALVTDWEILLNFSEGTCVIFGGLAAYALSGAAAQTAIAALCGGGECEVPQISNGTTICTLPSSVIVRLVP